MSLRSIAKPHRRLNVIAGEAKSDESGPDWTWRAGEAEIAGRGEAMARRYTAAMAAGLVGLLAGPIAAPAPAANPARTNQAIGGIIAAASTGPSPPAPTASWGARWSNGTWIGGAPHDTGAAVADPALVVASDRLLSAVEGYFGIFFDPIHGDDHFGNFGASLPCRHFLTFSRIESSSRHRVPVASQQFRDLLEGSRRPLDRVE